MITLAGLTNALKITGKQMKDVSIVINGAGAAAIAICKLLISAGARDIVLCDRKGAIYEGRQEGMNQYKEEISRITNPQKKMGSLENVLVGADVFIGVSAPGVVTKEMVEKMNHDAIIFACANPTPEILPEEAKAGGAQSCRHRAQRLSQPDQQCPGIPGNLPRGFGRACKRYQR